MENTTKKFNPVGRAFKTRAGAENYLTRNWTCDPEDFEGYVSEQADGTFQAFVHQLPIEPFNPFNL